MIAGDHRVRRILAARRAILPLAAPYLGVACLALFALASSGAITTELGLFARTSSAGAASTSSLKTYTDAHQHLAPGFVPAHAVSIHSSQLALARSPNSTHVSGSHSEAERLAAPTVRSGVAGALLIAITLARAH
jgi:hypothetical protein